HSQGEVAAAYVAGALSLEDAARIVARRSRLVRKLAGQGAMVAVELQPDRIREFLLPFGRRVGLAAHNGPHSCLVSGQVAEINELIARLSAAQVFVRQIRVNYASHFESVAQIEAELLAALSGLKPQRASLAMYSTVTTQRVSGPELDAAY